MNDSIKLHCTYGTNPLNRILKSDMKSAAYMTTMHIDEISRKEEIAITDNQMTTVSNFVCTRHTVCYKCNASGRCAH